MMIIRYWIKFVILNMFQFVTGTPCSTIKANLRIAVLAVHSKRNIRLVRAKKT